MAMTQCKECKHDVATSAKTCPNCGAINGAAYKGIRIAGLIYFAFLALIGWGIWSLLSGPPDNSAANADTQAQSAPQWYEGGTLHEASGLDWQKAAYADKLATAGDILARLNNVGSLSPQIAGRVNEIDDYKPLAAELVTQLDDAFAPDPDPAQNERMFANQTVKETSVMVMAMMGWVQIGG
ncbi:MAG: hypothetical protein ABGX82_02465 [Pseudomonas sp.]|uniref:hypothetical protein n=1 Tax=Pseudomonas sp. TaxID=306 RepID=UPI003241FB71